MNNNQKNGSQCSFIHKSMRTFLEGLKRQTLSQSYCGVRLKVSFKNVDTDALLKHLLERNIISPRVLAERLLAGLDIEAEARSLKITIAQTFVLHTAAVELLTPEERAFMESHLRTPKGKGLLPVDHPSIAPMLRAIRIDKRHVTTEVIRRWIELDRPWLFLPRGPLRAVDHRAKFGPARSQGARSTCTAFAATAVAEALEFLRDRRRGPQDFSEEFLWWYSKSGQLNAVDGYDHRVSLDHYSKNGVPDDVLLPYSGFNMTYNNAHIPVPDDAIDRAFDYRQPPFVTLTDRDVSSVKAALESGRCVAFDCDPFNWNTATGIVAFPDPLDSHVVRGGHATTIIGYIDRDDLDPHFEGGYFIVRNSWGDANSPTHLMGPEYGGHLLMPYGWYRRYTSAPATFGSDADPTGTAGVRQWKAEYFNNRSLRGTPAATEPLSDVAVNRRTGEEFSARFTQIRRLRPGWYRFALRGNDGMRLWVDDRLVINQWKEELSTRGSVEHYVTGGDHVLRVEYFTTRGSANVELQVEEVEFQYELFSNTELAGPPSATFRDTMTDMEWRHTPPVDSPSVNGQFSLRATGTKHFATGAYTFHTVHTGGCRMWVDDNLVLDDWSGLNGTGEPVTLSEGLHNVRVQFSHRTTLPDPDTKAYYRAALAFDWSELAWTGHIYNDDARGAFGDHLANVDGVHELFRVLTLTGEPVFAHLYSVPPPAAAAYQASDDRFFRLHFPNFASFVRGLSGTEGTETRREISSVICTRRVYVPTDARYEVRVDSNEVTRVCIDGNKVIDRIYFGTDPFVHEMTLHKGVHDVTIECADGSFEPGFDFSLQPANWQVNYFAGIELSGTPASTREVPGAEFVVINRPDTLPRSNWSARAVRAFLLGVGRFRIIVRADNGVRVKANGSIVINSWKDQQATTHTAVIEHSGGPIDLEVEYYHAEGGAELWFELKPDGFIGEYYRGIQLDKPTDSSDGSARNPPHAYRFEPGIDFDWGGTGRLARVGSDRFSARWWGLIELPVGRWKFKVTSDDGVRLFLDSRLLIDHWVDQAATLHEVIIDLAAGKRALRLEYYERTESAMCRLELERLFGPDQSIPI